MQPTTNEKLTQLIRLLRAAHNRSQDGYVLIIGGEASTIHGQPLIDELRSQILQELGGISDKPIPIDRFEELWAIATPRIRSGVLHDLHQQLRFTTGHTALASLLKERYFPIILTTTIDHLLESIFTASSGSGGQPPHLLSVLVNGRDTEQSIQDAISDFSPIYDYS